jgi:hypothetical protein
MAPYPITISDKLASQIAQALEASATAPTGIGKFKEFS